MNEIIILSGADGTGKSSIISRTMEKAGNCYYQWGRYHHYLQKIFNVYARLSGKSYYEIYEGERHGYHNYEGTSGQIYLILSFIDNYIAFILLRLKFRLIGKQIFVDRSIVDKVADLMVSGIKHRQILYIYNGLLLKELNNSQTFVIDCSYDNILERRDNLKYDKSLKDKLKAYKVLVKLYNIDTIKTDNKCVEKCSELIINEI